METQNNSGALFFLNFILCVLSTVILFSLVHIEYAKRDEPRRFNDNTVFSMVKSSIEIVYKPTKLAEEEYEGWFFDAKTKMKLDSICTHIAIWLPELVVFFFLLSFAFEFADHDDKFFTYLFLYTVLCVLSILVGVLLLLPSFILMLIVYLILNFVIFFIQNPLAFVLFLFLGLGLGGSTYYVLVIKE